MIKMGEHGFLPESIIRLGSLWWSLVVGGCVTKVSPSTPAMLGRLQSDCPSSVEPRFPRLCLRPLPVKCIVSYPQVVNTKKIDYLHIGGGNIVDVDLCIKMRASHYVHVCSVDFTSLGTSTLQ